MKTTTKELCIQSLLIALVTAFTMMFRIPVSATHGYIHLGDSMILLIAVFFGTKRGMMAGGIGSALADLLGGYAHWSPFTLLIKGLMGFLIGKIADAPQSGKFFTFRTALASFVGTVWMVLGYFIGGGILKSSFAVAAMSVPENTIQGIAGIIVFFVVGGAFYKAKVYKILPRQ